MLAWTHVALSHSRHTSLFCFGMTAPPRRIGGMGGGVAGVTGSAAAGEKAYSQVVDPMAGATTAGAATGSLGEGKAALGAASSSRKKSTRAPAGVRNNAWKDDDEWAAQRDEAAKAWWSAQQKSGDVGGLGEEEDEEEEEGYADDDDYDYDDYDYDEEELELELEAASDPRSALA